MASKRKPARGNDSAEPNFQTSRPRTSKAIAEPRPSYTLNGKSHATLGPGTYQAQELIDAGILEIGDGYRAKNSELGNEGMPFARAANINDGFHFQQADRFPSANIAQVGTKLSQPGDVVFTSKGTVGRFAFVTEDIEPFVYSPQLCYWRSTDSQALLPGFLYFWMQSSQFLNQIGYLKSQTDMADYVSLRDQRKMTVTFPPVSKQLEIAATLGTLEARISLLRQTSATLEAIAQTLFKSWFVDFDPVHAKAEGREPDDMDVAIAALFPDSFEESPLGPIPKGWKASTLGDLCTSHGGLIQTGPFGSQLHASDYIADGIPVVMPQDIQGRRVSLEKIARVPPADAARLSRHQLIPRDIVFSRRGDVGRHAVISSNESGWLCGTGCLLVRPGSDCPSPTFLSEHLARAETIAWLQRHAVGATMPNLNTGILSALPVLDPASNVMRSFETVAGIMEAKISLNHAAARSLAQLRDTLLPRLISGKLRLPDAQALIEEATS